MLLFHPHVEIIEDKHLDLRQLGHNVVNLTPTSASTGHHHLAQYHFELEPPTSITRPTTRTGRSSAGWTSSTSTESGPPCFPLPWRPAFPAARTAAATRLPAPFSAHRRCRRRSWPWRRKRWSHGFLILPCSSMARSTTPRSSTTTTCIRGII